MRIRYAIAPAMAAVMLVVGLYRPWRCLTELGDMAKLCVSPTAVDVCDAETCHDGHEFGFDIDTTLRSIDGDAFATLMHAAYWAALAAALVQLALAITLAITRDHWGYRLAGVLPAAIALVLTGVIAYGILRQPSGHTAAGLWITLAGALVGAVAPLVRRSPAVVR